MSAKLRVLTVFGTRPEAIKMAPVVMELARYPEEIESKVVVTAQHRDMLDLVLDHFAITPDYDLDVMRPGQSLTETAVRVLQGLEPIFSEEHPQGISREDYISNTPSKKVAIANKGLNTFLRLHPILNAAIDGCRPYPIQVTYGTDDEFDKIIAGRLKYRDLATQYNAQPDKFQTFARFEGGISGGFYDPRTQGKRVSYQAANPLNFFRP